MDNSKKIIPIFVRSAKNIFFGVPQNASISLRAPRGEKGGKSPATPLRQLRVYLLCDTYPTVKSPCFLDLVPMVRWHMTALCYPT